MSYFLTCTIVWIKYSENRKINVQVLVETSVLMGVSLAQNVFLQNNCRYAALERKALGRSFLCTLAFRREVFKTAFY